MRKINMIVLILKKYLKSYEVLINKIRINHRKNNKYLVILKIIMKIKILKKIKNK